MATPTYDPNPLGLTFSRGVPRELTHRWSLAEVYVTDSRQSGPESYAVAFQLSRSHVLWADRVVPRFDPLMAVEAARQGTFVIAHRYLGVPTDGFSFISNDIGFTVLDDDAFVDDGAGPLNGIFRVTLLGLTRVEDDVTAMTFESTVEIGGRTAMVVSGSLTVLRSDDMATLRAPSVCGAPAVARPPRRRLAPAAVGRVDARNVVLGPPETRAGMYPLLVDQRHPAFFDHPQDHIPGPLLVEAFRQALIVTATEDGIGAAEELDIAKGHLRFQRFAELHVPTLLRTERQPPPTSAVCAVRIDLVQEGEVLATCEAEARAIPRTPTGTPTTP